MLKSTAAVLGFLFLLSVAYYLSFWSLFDVNIFQYMAVEDIIKGIAYPLRYAGVWILGLILLVVITVILSVFTEDTTLESTPGIKNFIKIFGGLTALMGGIYAGFHSVIAIGMIFSIIASILIIVLYTLVEKNPVDPARPEKGSSLQRMFEVFTAYSAIFLIINSIVSGQVEGYRIKYGQEYNYVMVKDLKEKVDSDAMFLVYLGAVSDKYIFIDKDGFERFFIEKSELPSLKVNHFDYNDEATVKYMNGRLRIDSLQIRKDTLQIKLKPKVVPELEIKPKLEAKQHAELEKA